MTSPGPSTSTTRWSGRPAGGARSIFDDATSVRPADSGTDVTIRSPTRLWLTSPPVAVGTGTSAPRVATGAAVLGSTTAMPSNVGFALPMRLSARSLPDASCAATGCTAAERLWDAAVRSPPIRSAAACAVFCTSRVAGSGIECGGGVLSSIKSAAPTRATISKSAGPVMMPVGNPGLGNVCVPASRRITPGPPRKSVAGLSIISTMSPSVSV